MTDENVDSDLQNLLDQIEEAQITGAAEDECPKEVEENNIKNESDDDIELKKEGLDDELTQAEEIDKQLEKLGVDLEDEDDEDDEDEDDEDDEDEDDEDDFQVDVVDAELMEAGEDKEYQLQREKLKKDVLGMITKHCDSSDKMFEEAEVDRKRAEEIISIVLPRIEADNYKAADIQTVAALLQTKADISRNRSGMMDSISRLFAALKNNPIGDIKSGDDEQIDKEELERLLGSGPK